MPTLDELLAANQPSGLDKLKDLYNQIGTEQPYTEALATKAGPLPTSPDPLAASVSEFSIAPNAAAPLETAVSEAAPSLAETIGYGAGSALRTTAPVLRGAGWAGILSNLYGGSAGEPNLANTSSSKPEDVGVPGMVAMGQDLVPVSSGGDSGINPDKNASLFGMVSDKAKQLTQQGDVNTPADSMKGKLAMLQRGPASTETPPSQPASDPLKDILSKIYGNDDEALNKAITQRNQADLIGMLGKAANIAGAALSRGTIAQQDEVYNNILQNASQPIQDVLMKRQAKMQQIETGLKMSDFDDKIQLRDPNSAASNALRNAAAQIMQATGMKAPPNFENMAGEQIKTIIPMADTIGKAQMYQAMRQQIFQRQQEINSTKAKSDMASRISMTLNRGTPAQATNSIRAANNILDLFKNGPQDQTDQSNPANWGAPKVHLFNTELEKMAKGGIPSEKGAQTIPPNVLSQFSKALSFTTGDVVPTHQAPVIMSVLPYVNNIKNTSFDYVRNQVLNPMMSGFNKRVSPDDMEDYKRSLPKEYFPELWGGQDNSVSMPKVGEVRKGYTFLGGNPSNPQSWKKQ